MTKILSVEQLIAEKVKYGLNEERAIEKTVHIPRINADIKLEIMKSDVQDFLEVTNSKNMSEQEAESAGHTLIYSIVKEPNLKDKTLHDAYECAEPTDIVPAIFTDGEMLDIVDVAIESTGFRRGSVQVVEELKN